MIKLKQIKLWPKIIYENLTYIVVGIVAFTLLWTFLLHAFYHYMPASYFISNITATAYPTQEHKDVYVRVCRDRRGDYTATGIRTIYKVPESKNINDGFQVARTTLRPFAIDGGRCDNTTLYRSDYDFSSGDYYFRTTIDVKIQYGEVKTYTYTSNKFTIFPLQTSDVQQQIESLRKEIERLQSLEPATGVQQSETAITPSTSSNQTKAPENSGGNSGNTSEKTDPIPNKCIVDFTLPVISTNVKALC